MLIFHSDGISDFSFYKIIMSQSFHFILKPFVTQPWRWPIILIDKHVSTTTPSEEVSRRPKTAFRCSARIVYFNFATLRQVLQKRQIRLCLSFKRLSGFGHQIAFKAGRSEMLVYSAQPQTWLSSQLNVKVMQKSRPAAVTCVVSTSAMQQRDGAVIMRHAQS